MFRPNKRQSSGFTIVYYEVIIQYAHLRLDVEISSPSLCGIYYAIDYYTICITASRC
jgi:hypothetical protein